MRYLKIIFSFLILKFAVQANCQQIPELNVRHWGQERKSAQPTLSMRLNGAAGFSVIIPQWMRSQNDKYIFQNIPVILERLGARNIDIVSAKYEVKSPEQGIAQYFKKPDQSLGELTDFTDNIVVVPQLVSAFPDFEMLYIDFHDLVNDWSWRIDIEIPNKFDKYFNKFKQSVTPQITYSFEQEDRFRPIFYALSWYNPQWYVQNATQNGCDEYEGKYTYDDYECFLKEYNGKYYLVNTNKTKYSRWDGVGIVKAILTPTAAPDVFTCEYFDVYRVKQKGTAGFGQGFLKFFLEGSENPTYLKTWPSSQQSITPRINSWSGTGFALKNGYIVTNYHVIENANSITVKGVKGDFNNSFHAFVVASDRFNDLAIIKITDNSFSGFGQIPYTISSSTSDVGEEVYVLGYPLTSTMGDEIKLTTGVVSSKTGFQGDVALYQISAPIQPGNSGGPLFDRKGNIIGIVSAKHSGAENVGYAIKSSYLRNLIESSVNKSIIPTANTVSTLPLTGKVRAEKNFVFYIECTSGRSINTSSYQNHNTSSAKVYNHPSVTSRGDSKLQILSVSLSPEATVIEFSDNNSSNGGYYPWFSISPDAYILVNDTKYKLRSAEGIALAPNVTYFSYANETKTFRLIFSPIPSETTSFDFIESPDSQWKLFGIKLRD